jgi:hypothetical protein
MTIRILLDHDIEGYGVFVKAGLHETGWDQDFQFEFVRLDDLGLPANCPDCEIWRRCQQDGLLLLTQNRNSDDETSLQITLERENTAPSLPVLTLGDAERLRAADYRWQVANSFATVVVYLDYYRGTGRVFVPS